VRVVGIGASAGGLEALEEFPAQVPPASGLADLVVQHLDPTQKAMLAQLLQRATPMPVREATERLRIAPHAVYVIPPNRALTLTGGMLHLTAPEQPRGLRRPIDELFESIASEQQEHAVGVVLSGMGADGTVGLKAIKATGGLALAQAPESAQFDSMPRSALAAGCVDIVCAPGEMLAQSDMRNLLNSTDIATLFLDNELNVRHFTEKARKIIALRDSDIGRPLGDLTSQLEYADLQADVQEMLRTLVVSEKQIHSRDGHWYAVRVMPYRTHDDVIQGAVITFVDITATKELEARLRAGG
jgi:PAS domain S-box-containing protein